MRAIFGLGSILIVVLIIGVLAAESLGSNGTTPTTLVPATTTTGPAHNGTTTTTISTDQQAEVAACVANAETIETAIGAYDAVSLTPLPVETPGAGSGDVDPGVPSSYATATSAASLVRAGDLSAWPSNQTGYALSLSTTVAGAVEIYVPATARTGTEFENESATTGCNAL